MSLTEEQRHEDELDYNYRSAAGRVADESPVPEAVARIAASCGTDAPTFSRNRPGMSAFVFDGGVVFHTCFTYARGLDGILGMYPWLDRAPTGRNETGARWRRHDDEV